MKRERIYDIEGNSTDWVIETRINWFVFLLLIIVTILFIGATVFSVLFWLWAYL